jgi:hypothetical protein
MKVDDRERVSKNLSIMDSIKKSKPERMFEDDIRTFHIDYNPVEKSSK